MLIPLALVLVLAGCGGDGESTGTGPGEGELLPPAGDASGEGGVEVVLEEQEGSGFSGRAELVPQDEATLVVIELDDPGADPNAYLQEGDCTSVSADAAEVLALFLDGRSETTIDEELETLVAGGYVLTLHDPASEDLQSPAACGEIREEGS